MYKCNTYDVLLTHIIYYCCLSFLTCKRSVRKSMAKQMAKQKTKKQKSHRYKQQFNGCQRVREKRGSTRG